MKLPTFGSVLAAHPTSSGFGWVAFDQAGVLVDWGVASAKQGRKLRQIDRFKRLLARFEPAALALEAHEGERPRAQRIRDLYGAFDRAASKAGARVHVYDREAVSSALDIPLRASRYDVARKVVELHPELSHRMPRKQALGASEDPRQSLFAAASLALTYLVAMGID